MDSSKDLMLKSNRHQLILTILFIVFILFDFRLPDNLAKGIDNPFGMVIVILLSLSLFCFANPILGFTGFVVAYELIRRSGIQTGSQALSQYVITEDQKFRQMDSFNNNINNNKLYSSLEEQVVSNMVPYINKVQPDNCNVKPVLEKQHDAASIHYKGVV
tara:strand:+ start:345 stop:824 length:480 start_codon:yes stop_codon:yes gene_type:complete